MFPYYHCKELIVQVVQPKRSLMEAPLQSPSSSGDDIACFIIGTLVQKSRIEEVV